MAIVKPVIPVKLFCGIIAASEEMIQRAQGTLVSLYGPIDMESDSFSFDFTNYYYDEMGDGLLRKFVSFEERIDPSEIIDIKLKTNELEEEFGERTEGGLKRKVNLDPGYIAPSKLILATTKDFSHRIYLGRGIYAEITLSFSKEGAKHHPLSYPDFKSDKYSAFFLKVRDTLLPSGKGI